MLNNIILNTGKTRSLVTKIVFYMVVFFICPSLSGMNKDSLRQEIALTKQPDKLFFLYKSMADEYFFTSDIDSFDLYVRGMFSISSELVVDSIKEIAYNYMTYNFSNLGDEINSIYCIEKALFYCKKGSSFRSIAFYYKDLGIAYKKFKNYDISRYYLLSSIEMASKASHGTERQYTHLAEVYLNLGNIDSAFIAIQKSMEYLADSMDHYGRARQYFVFGKVLLASHDLSLAKSYFESCRRIVHLNKVNSPTLNYEGHYAALLAEQNQTQDCITILNEGIDRALKIRDYEFVASLYLQLQKLYYKLNRIDSSVIAAIQYKSYYKSAHVLKKSNDSFSKSTELFLKKQQEQSLEMDNKKHQQSLLTYLICFLVIAGLLILFVVLSHHALINESMVRTIGMIILVMLFEFIYVLIFPFLSHYFHSNQFLLISSLVCISACIIPIHHYIEHKIISILHRKNSEAHHARAMAKLNELKKITNE